MQDNTNNSPPQPNQPASTASADPVSVGSVAKEYESPVSPDIKPEEIQEYQVSKEVSAHVQIRTEKPDIPPDLIQIGVTHAPSDQNMSAPVSNQVSVPLNDDQINDGLHHPITDSIRWLAEWCLVQLKRAHVHLTKVKGRYIRVLEKT